MMKFEERKRNDFRKREQKNKVNFELANVGHTNLRLVELPRKEPVLYFASSRESLDEQLKSLLTTVLSDVFGERDKSITTEEIEARIIGEVSVFSPNFRVRESPEIFSEDFLRSIGMYIFCKDLYVKRIMYATFIVVSKTGFAWIIECFSGNIIAIGRYDEQRLINLIKIMEVGNGTE
jgi:hypothetical protein